MEWVNRIALVMRPRRRFVEWINGQGTTEFKLDLDSARARPILYLVAADPEEAEESLQNIIDQYATEIFEAQLSMWCADEAQWPLNRSPHVFRDWFEVSVATEVYDCDEDVDWIEPIDDDLDDGLQPGDIDPESGNLVVDNEVMTQCMWCGSELEEDSPILTINLQLREDVESPPPGVVEVTIGTRSLRVLVPMPTSPAAKEGVAAMIMVCSESCGEEVKVAIAKSQSAWLS